MWAITKVSFFAALTPTEVIARSSPMANDAAISYRGYNYRFEIATLPSVARDDAGQSYSGSLYNLEFAYHDAFPLVMGEWVCFVIFYFSSYRFCGDSA